MKRSKRIYLLLGVLVVICAATFAVSAYEEHKEAIKNSDEIILSVDIDDVTSLSWEYDSEKLSFHKDNDWLYDEDEAFPVDEEKIGEMLELFQEFGVSFSIDDVEDLSQYGLDDPICTIQITAGDQDYSILLGDYSTMDSERYVSIGDGRVYLVKNDPLDYFDAVLSDMIDHDETPYFDQVTNIRFSGKEEYQIVYEEESESTYCSDDIYFVERDNGSQPLDTSLVDSYLQTISGLDLTSYVTYNASEEELQACGLDDPTLSIHIEYVSTNEETETASNSFDLHIGYDAEGEKLEVQPTSEESETSDSETDDKDKTVAFMRVGESPIIYKVTGEDCSTLLDVSYNSFRHKQVFPASFDVINQIDISLEGVEHTLSSEEKDGERIWKYQETEVDTSQLRSALTNLEADSFTEKEADQKEEISLTLHLDNENFPTVQIDLYRYDGTDCLAVVDGDPVSLVPRASVVDLIESVNAIVLSES